MIIEGGFSIMICSKRYIQGIIRICFLILSIVLVLNHHPQNQKCFAYAAFYGQPKITSSVPSRISSSTIFSFGNSRTANKILSLSSPAEDNFTNKPSQQLMKKLTRPEKKALEREKKESLADNTNKNNKSISQQRRSTLAAVEQLSKDSSQPEDVMRAIKRAQYMQHEKSLVQIQSFLCDSDKDILCNNSSLLTRLAVAFLSIPNHQHAQEVLTLRNRTNNSIPHDSAALIRALLRVQNVTEARTILEHELPLTETEEPKDVLRIQCRAQSLASIASYYFLNGNATEAIQTCDVLLRPLGAILRLHNNEMFKMPWLKLIQSANQCEVQIRTGKKQQPCVDTTTNVVYTVLDVMNTFPSDNDDLIYEALSNALVRRVEFVTGAVSMNDLPPNDRGEVAFIGRSNVGKSSLVNMVLNRKSLAYISKRPGKTQQFNYFAVNDKPDLLRQIKYGDEVSGEKDRDSFYIVDMPGFGYAEVPQQQRQKWSDFMQTYASKRDNLRVLFHLVDSRHGPSADDERIMSEIGSVVREKISYVIVLTKSDKNGGGAGRVSNSVMDSLRVAMKNANIKNSPVLLTSAETKLGRDDIWRYLKMAAEV